MNDIWLRVINDLRSNPRDLHTIPKVVGRFEQFKQC
jgi:hypothetical protein